MSRASIRAASDPVEAREACRDLPAVNALKSHCHNGHEFTPENTILKGSPPHHRACRACQRQYDADHKRRTKRSRTPREMAGRLLRKAVARGKIVRPDHCQECGAACVPHGHHHDYTQPLNVTWLCVPCHVKEHRK